MRFQSQLLKCALSVLMLALSTQAQPNIPERVLKVREFAATLLEARAPGQRSQLLESNNPLVTVELRRHLISVGSNLLLMGSYTAALEHFSVANDVSEKIGDKEGLAAASLNIGTVHYFQSNYPVAIEFYKKARDLFVEVKNQYEAAKALSGLALIYKDSRKDADALASFKQVLDEFTKLGDKDEIGNAWANIGALYYSQGNYATAMEAFQKSHAANGNPENIIRVGDALYMQGDYAQAFSYYKQALKALPNGSVGIVAALTGAANSAYYQGNYDEALEFYEKTFLAQQAHRERLGMANSLRGAGNVHRARGDYGAALENYFKSLELMQQARAPIGPILTSIGNARSLQGNHTLAVEYFQKALVEFEAKGNKVDIARTLSQLGNSHFLNGSYDLALESFNKSLTLRQAMNDVPGMANQLSGIGTVYLTQIKYDDALKNYRQALSIFESMGSVEGAALSLTQIADTLLYRGDLTPALESATRAVDLSKQANNTDILWYALLLVGKANHRLDHPDLALKALNESIGLVESLRAEPTFNPDGERSGKLPYLAAVDLMVSQDKAAEAFEYAERAKVQTLYELLRRNNARSTKGLTQAEVVQEQKLIAEATSLQAQIERDAELRTSSEARRIVLRNRLNQARRNFADLRLEFYALRPQLKIHRGEIATIKVEELRQLLPDRQTALLEYVATEKKIYLFVMTQAEGARARTAPTVVSMKAYPLATTHDQIAPLVNQFVESLTRKSDGYSEQGRALYDSLILPAATQLQNKTKLVIVPDGVLWRLPFDALQKDNETFLIDTAQISHVPSLSSLRDIRKTNLVKRVPAPVSLFGNPILSQEFSKRVELSYVDQKLSSSMDQETEVSNISVLYPKPLSRINVGELASEENARSQLAQAGVLHFSAPSIIDDASPMSSFIALTSGTAKSDDGFFQLREIFNAQSYARLVVTSHAQVRFNGSFSGLTGVFWSYFVIGSPTFVTSRWENSSATQIMTSFHKELQTPSAPTSTANALRKSLLTVRRAAGYEHPHFWAGFTLVGDTK